MGRERSALNYESNKRVQSKNNSKQGKRVLKPCTHLMGWSFEAYKGFLTWTRLTYSILPPELSPCLAVRNFSNKQSTKFDPFAYPLPTSHFPLVQRTALSMRASLFSLCCLHAIYFLIRHFSHATFFTPFIFLTLYCPQSLLLTLNTEIKFIIIITITVRSVEHSFTMCS